MQDPKIQDALDLLGEIKTLIVRRKHAFERFLLSPFIRVILGIWVGLLIGIGVWLIVDGESFVRVWFSSPWIWLAVVGVVIIGGGWLKLLAFRDVFVNKSPFQAIYDILGKPLLLMVVVVVMVFVALHAWIILRGTWEYLFSLWAMWLGFLYVLYGAFLSVLWLLVVGIWLIGGGIIVLFWVPKTFGEMGLAFLFVFALSYLWLLCFLEIEARVRK